MDKAIKWILSSPHHLRELLNFLAPNWAEMLDFNTLKKLDPSLISREFRESIRDALFLIQCKEGHRSVVIHFLLEHQSRPAREIRFRFQKSQMGTWTLFEERQRSLEEKDPYPPIVPLLIYTGRDNWEVPGLKEYFGFSEDFAPFTPEVALLFFGLFTKKGRAFIQSKTALSLCFELLSSLDLKLEEFQAVLERVERELWENFDREIVLCWDLWLLVGAVLHRRPVEEQEILFEMIGSKLPEEMIEDVEIMKKSYADVIFEKGIEKGIEKGEIKKSQEDILGILDARFGQVSTELVEKVKAITDIKHLDQLIRLAATCESLEGFSGGMASEQVGL